MDAKEKLHLQEVHIIFNDTPCGPARLDFELFLVRLFAGDGRHTPLHRNDGVTGANELLRETYRRSRGRPGASPMPP